MVVDLVVDTNVLFSALYGPDSVPGRIVELGLEGAATLYAPEAVRDELERNLRGTLGYTGNEVEGTLQSLPVEWIEEPVYEPDLEVARRAIGDASDAPVVAAALTVDAPIVSGDDDFHPLEDGVVETYRPRGAAGELGDG